MSTREYRHADPRQGAAPQRQSRASDAGLNILLLALAVTVLFLAMTWLLRLESTLPDIRAPRSTESSSVLNGHGLLSPGFHAIRSVDGEIRGDWLVQEVGDSGWLATEEEGSRIRAAFYGTELYLLARVGPEAGIAYVTINNRPAPLLPEDENGTFINLWAVSATDRPVLLASGLAHGEHLVEITASGDGEVAVSGFEVVAQTPFPWAFRLGYAGLIGGLFLIIRQLLGTLSQAGRGTLLSERTHSPGDDR